MTNQPISHLNLTFDLPVTLDEITYMSIDHKLNQHAIARIQGILNPDVKMDEIISITDSACIKIKAKQNGKEKILFSGVPIHVESRFIDNIHYLYLTLNSFSIKLDYKKIKRSFQNKKNLYYNIFKQIMDESSGSLLDMAAKETEQNCAVIQYEESNWELMVRLASRLGAVMVSDIQKEQPAISIGMPEEGEEYTEDVHNFELSKDLDSYMKYISNYGGYTQLDLTVYKIETFHYYYLGDKVRYNDANFIVAEKHSELVNGLLINGYILQQKGGLKQNIFYNPNVCGIGIDGEVIAVEKDTVKVHLSIDESQSVDEAYWYTLNTPYTTESQTGFYVMPQVGDNVKLYIPKTDETKAYIKVINRTDGEENPKTQDPSIKYLGTIHGKEMKLAPKELTFSANEFITHIKLEDANGIEITSDHNITLEADRNMKIYCSDLNMEAGERIVINTPLANIIVDETQHYKSF